MASSMLDTESSLPAPAAHGLLKAVAGAGDSDRIVWLFETTARVCSGETGWRLSRAYRQEAGFCG